MDLAHSAYGNVHSIPTARFVELEIGGYSVPLQGVLGFVIGAVVVAALLQ